MTLSEEVNPNTESIYILPKTAKPGCDRRHSEPLLATTKVTCGRLRRACMYSALVGAGDIDNLAAGHAERRDVFPYFEDYPV